MIRFYAPQILTTHCLPESDSAHAVRVLRMHAGDKIEVVDGMGNLYGCTLLSEHSKHADVAIDWSRPIAKAWPVDITVMVAPTKNNDRMEWLVEKLVEVGVDRFVPVRCDRSERRDIKVERLEKIAVAAMKQSLKARLPQIDPMTPLAQALQTLGPCQRFVGYCDDAVERRLLAREYTAGSNVALLIGPEGDFSPREIELCLNSGFVPVTMGDNRLRTETAALVACDTCHIVNQLKL